MVRFDRRVRRRCASRWGRARRPPFPHPMDWEPQSLSNPRVEREGIPWMGGSTVGRVTTKGRGWTWMAEPLLLYTRR
eukprot:scaffold37_cov346-Pavlova_lutheri.AAC.10